MNFFKMSGVFFLTALLAALSWSEIATAAESPVHDSLTPEQAREIDDLPEDCAMTDKMKLPKSSKSVGGITLAGNPTTLRRVTSEKIQVHNSPNGKVINSFPRNFVLLLEGKKDSWVLVRGYWTRACDYGWILEKGIVNKNREELEAAGIVGR